MSLDGPVSICPDHGEFNLHTGCLDCPHEAESWRRPITAYRQQPPRLIALCSPAMGSGKSVVAAHLVERHGFVHLKFAGILKNMARAMLRGIGIPDPMIERYVEGDLKETVIPEVGVTSRFLQQRLGTEFGRNCIREDLWAHLTQQAARRHLADGRSVVIDDMRFTNELEKVVEIGGHPIRIVRPGVTVAGGAHVSEGQLDGIMMLRIDNDGTIDDLKRKADTLALCPLRAS